MTQPSGEASATLLAPAPRLELWAVARWVTPWVGWSFPVPTPVMLAAAIVVAAVLTRGQM